MMPGSTLDGPSWDFLNDGDMIHDYLNHVAIGCVAGVGGADPVDCESVVWRGGHKIYDHVNQVATDCETAGCPAGVWEGWNLAGLVNGRSVAERPVTLLSVNGDEHSQGCSGLQLQDQGVALCCCISDHEAAQENFGPPWIT